jgi:hypothetical protein
MRLNRQYYGGETALLAHAVRLFRGFLGKNGSPSWIRTNDQVINSHLLYR